MLVCGCDHCPLIGVHWCLLFEVKVMGTPHCSFWNNFCCFLLFFLLFFKFIFVVYFYAFQRVLETFTMTNTLQWACLTLSLSMIDYLYIREENSWSNSGSFLTLYTFILNSFQERVVALNFNFMIQTAEMLFRGESVGTSKG